MQVGVGTCRSITASVEKYTRGMSGESRYLLISNLLTFRMSQSFGWDVWGVRAGGTDGGRRLGFRAEISV
jgi:hypothetical protein